MRSKRFLQQTRAVALLSACLLCNAACVNEIESETNVKAGDIPITFTVKVRKAPTKVINNQFEKGDKVSLYAMLSGTGIEQERYIDNLCLTCTDGNTLTPQTPVFYPEGENAALDFIAYYPFQANGVAAHTHTLPITVNTDQSLPEDHSTSDFLVAQKAGVNSSENPVELVFKHQLANIKIVLIPGEGENITEMFQASPRIIGSGFQTHGTYDMTTGKVTPEGDAHDIIPYGTWKEEDGKLVGKEFIVIPQAISNQMLQMEWDGRIYTCPMPENFENEFEGNRQYVIDITATQSDSEILDDISVSIEDWSDAITEESNNTEDNTAIHLAVLSFEKSNIYRVHSNDGKVIAEICLEYLKSDEQAEQAIVSYPVNEDNTADLTKGTVLQIVGNTDNVHGGSIAWDLSQNNYTYTPGSSPAIAQVHYDEQGNVLTTSLENAATVSILAYCIRDLRRGTPMREYPIVKIGTQYWMRSNLQATSYRDGTTLAKQEVQGQTPGYFTLDEAEYFYNGYALEENELAPEDWAIPSREDWEKLYEYVGSEAAALKSGTWQPNPEDDLVAPATNLSMFDLRPIGIWHNTEINSVGKACGLWTLENSSTIPDETIFFTQKSNTTIWETTWSSNHIETDAEDYLTFYKALSIRCIKKE